MPRRQGRQLPRAEPIPRLLDALKRRDVASFATAVDEAAAPGDKRGNLLLEFVEETTDSPYYLSVTESSPAEGNNKGLQFQIHVVQVVLTPGEVGALVAHFRILGAAPPARRPPQPSALLRGDELARVLPISDSAGRVLSAENIAIATGLAVIVPVSTLGSLLVLLAIASNFEVTKNSVITGCLWMIAGLVYQFLCGGYLPNRFYHRKSLTAIASRADAVVQPDDPEAIYVQVIARDCPARKLLEPATDIGLMRIDTDRHTLHYEGDTERWIIPGSSLISCDVEDFEGVFSWEINGGLASDTVPMVVLRARVDGPVWECPRTPRKPLSDSNLEHAT